MATLEKLRKDIDKRHNVLEKWINSGVKSDKEIGRYRLKLEEMEIELEDALEEHQESILEKDGKDADSAAALAAIMDDINTLIEDYDVYYVSQNSGCYAYKSAGDVIPTTSSSSAFKNRHSILQEKGAWIAFTEELDKTNRIKDKFVYSLDAVPDRHLNLFDSSWLVSMMEDVNEEHYQDTKLHPIFEVVMETISQQKKHWRDHFEKWMLRKIEKPGDYSIPVLIMYDGAKCCKTLLFGGIFTGLFGPDGAWVTKFGNFFASFNEKILGKFTILLDEKPPNLEYSNQLKQITGGKELDVNGKYKAMVTVPNHLGLGVTSNDEFCPINMEGGPQDMRYSVFRYSKSVYDIAPKVYSTNLMKQDLNIDDEMWDTFSTTQQVEAWMRAFDTELSDKAQASAFVYQMVKKHGRQTTPLTAYHGSDYKEACRQNKQSHESVCDIIFGDEDFSGITVRTLNNYYKSYTKENAKGYKLKPEKFSKYAEEYIAKSTIVKRVVTVEGVSKWVFFDTQRPLFVDDTKYVNDDGDYISDFVSSSDEVNKSGVSGKGTVTDLSALRKKLKNMQ